MSEEEWFIPIETTFGDEIMAEVDRVIEEAFSDLPDEETPPWPRWLFGNQPDAEARGDYVTEAMAGAARRAALEGGVGLAGDLAALMGFDEAWLMVYDIAMTYAVRIALHSLIGYKHAGTEGIFFPEDYTRGSLINAVNEAVIPLGKEEDE